MQLYVVLLGLTLTFTAASPFDLAPRGTHLCVADAFKGEVCKCYARAWNEWQVLGECTVDSDCPPMRKTFHHIPSPSFACVGFNSNNPSQRQSDLDTLMDKDNLMKIRWKEAQFDCYCEDDCEENTNRFEMRCEKKSSLNLRKEDNRPVEVDYKGMPYICACKGQNCNKDKTNSLEFDCEENGLPEPKAMSYGTQPGEFLNGTQPGEVLNGTQPGEFPDGTQPGEILNGTQPGEFPNGTQPGEVLNVTQPGEFLNGTQPGALLNGTRPGEA